MVFFFTKPVVTFKVDEIAEVNNTIQTPETISKTEIENMIKTDNLNKEEKEHLLKVL